MSFLLLASTIHLSVIEGSDVSLHCDEKGMWIIEESHRGGPVRKLFFYICVFCISFVL
jgi:hypothetical protein